jgi:hypothetical protein
MCETCTVCHSNQGTPLPPYVKCCRPRKERTLHGKAPKAPAPAPDLSCYRTYWIDVPVFTPLILALSFQISRRLWTTFCLGMNTQRPNGLSICVFISCIRKPCPYFLFSSPRVFSAPTRRVGRPSHTQAKLFLESTPRDSIHSLIIPQFLSPF